MKNIAVILAAGKGSRIGDTTPKQYMQVAGKMIIEHSIEAFETHPDIDEICIVVAAEYRDKIEALCRDNGYRKVGKIVEGGAERYASSLNAIRAYDGCDGQECNLIFHDAARPLVSCRVISEVVNALETNEAADVAVSATDTILIASPDGTIASIPLRATLWNSQTPQAFRLSLIRRAYEQGMADPAFATTDDCGVVVRYCPETPIKIVEGDTFNIKLTYKDDLPQLERLFALHRS